MIAHKNRYSIIFKAVAIILICLFIANDIVFAASTPYISSDASTLAIPAKSPDSEFRKKFKSLANKLAHPALNNFIETQVEKEKAILGKDWGRQKTRTISIGDSALDENARHSAEYLNSVMLVSVTGLLSRVGQIAHVGSNGKDDGGIAVIYVDSLLYKEFANRTDLDYEYINTMLLTYEPDEGSADVNIAGVPETIPGKIIASQEPDADTVGMAEQLTASAPAEEPFFKKHSARIYIFSTVAAGFIMSAVFSVFIDWSQSNIAIAAINIVLITILNFDIVEGFVSHVLGFSKKSVLPGINIEGSVPSGFKTIAYYPILLKTEDEVRFFDENLVPSIENNNDPNIKWVVLSTSPDGIRELERGRVLELQKKYGRDRIFYIHRDASMDNWEKKRGGYIQFMIWLKNSLRPDGISDKDPRFPACPAGRVFDEVLGAVSALEDVRNLAMSDSDTIWTKNSIKKLIAKIEHPANKKYGIIQGVVEPYNTGESALIKYSYHARALKQTNFIGHGAGWNVERFLSDMAGKIKEGYPSHDIIEGFFSKPGLTEDIISLEQLPPNLFLQIKQWDRWYKGNKVSLVFFKKYVPDESGKLIRNPATIVDKYLLYLSTKSYLSAPVFVALILINMILSDLIAFKSIIVLNAIYGVLIFFRFHGSAMAGNRTAGGFFRSAQNLIMFILLYPVNIAAVSIVVTRSHIDGLVDKLKKEEKKFTWDPQSGLAKELTLKQSFYSLWHLVLFSAAIIALYHDYIGVGLGYFFGSLLVSPFTVWYSSQTSSVQPASALASGAPAARSLESYFKDSFHSMELLLSERSGIPIDKGVVEDGKIRVIQSLTSPTNIGMGLLQYVSARDMKFAAEDEARAVILRMLKTLSKMERHSSGLFYSWYETNAEEPFVTSRYVPSIDNTNLTAALKIVGEAYKNDGTAEGKEISRLAYAIIDPQDYSVIYDEAKGLLAGGITAEGKKETWYPAETLGSESRMSSQIIAALGKIDKATILNSKIEIRKYRLSTDEEIPVLATWDGGAFQMFMPNLFVAEDLNPVMKMLLFNYTRVMEDQGNTRNILNKGIAAAYSACETANGYNGEQGIAALAQNPNASRSRPGYYKWQSAITPHALFLSGTVNRNLAINNLTKLKDMPGIYIDGFGFVDSLAASDGSSVPSKLVLDEGMILAAIYKMSDPEGLGLAKYLYGSDIGKDLKNILKVQDDKLKEAIDTLASTKPQTELETSPPKDESLIVTAPDPVPDAPESILSDIYPPEIKTALYVMNKLMPSELEKSKVYEIRYDSARLREYQRKAGMSDEFSPETLLKTYVQCLQLRVPCKKPEEAMQVIKLIECPTRGDKEQDLISITCYQDRSKTRIVGEGHVNIRGDLQGQALKITGMLNMALIASNVPDLPGELDKYSQLIDVIEAQYRDITGKELCRDEAGKRLSPEELLRTIRSIELPSASKIPFDKAAEYYRLTITQLQQAA